MIVNVVISEKEGVCYLLMTDKVANRTSPSPSLVTWCGNTLSANGRWQVRTHEQGLSVFHDINKCPTNGNTVKPLPQILLVSTVTGHT